MARYGFSRQIQTRAVSSVYGKIETLLLAFPGKQSNITKKQVQDRYGEIFRAFNDRVTFVVLGHFGDAITAGDEAKSAFMEVLLDHKIDPHHHLVFYHTPFAGSLCKKTHDVHSEYCQDPFVVMETELGQTVLLEPIRHGNPENANLAEQFAFHAGFLIQPSHVVIEGGNVLIGDDFALIGKNGLKHNLDFAEKMKPGHAKDWLESYLKRTLGVRYILWVGTKETMDCGPFHSTGAEKLQPFFHLDLFTTLLGKTNNGKECLLLAKIDIDQVEGASPSEQEILRKVNNALDSIENDLETYGNDLPGPILEVHRNEIGGKVIPTSKGNCFVPFAYNNVQVEQYQNIRRIYLPSFHGMERLETKFKEQLMRLGFNLIRPIADKFENYAENGGSLHCLSAVITRNPN